MQCDYYDAAVCRSCTHLPVGYDEQVRRKQALVAAALPAVEWRAPVTSAESGFRNKAKMVVGGQRGEPTLGILDRDRHGVDLTGCGLHLAGIRDALAVLGPMLAAWGLTPYDIGARSGELKHLIVTESPAGELMVRFVLRSADQIELIDVDALRRALPVAVVSVNLQPEHKAILEGPEEVLLLGQTLLMEVNGIGLHLRPGGFFQTNTEVAAALYRHARDIVVAADPGSVWDLYCGVGGFALHAAAPGRSVLGIETSAPAIDAARASATELGLDAHFLVGDATAGITAPTHRLTHPDLVILNPPRRGIGALAEWIGASGVREVVYSSCNVATLAKDLAVMKSYTLHSARLLDMFPHTDHHEVLVHLRRR
ncbi:MAG: methyltransferase domain-containing protein [Nocardioides sp.]